MKRLKWIIAICGVVALGCNAMLAYDMQTEDSESDSSGLDSETNGSLKGLGTACQGADECHSGNCAQTPEGNAVCCSAPCDGICQACGNNGSCDQMPPTDPACESFACPEDTVCATYVDALTEPQCAALGQCHTEATWCADTYAPTTTLCGQVMTCDGAGNCNCAADAPCNSECPCGVGEGTCNIDSDCQTGLVCTTDAIAKLGTDAASCMPAHCVNDTLDAKDGETSQDCGGNCGCRATYTKHLIQVPSNTVYLEDISGDGSMLVGYYKYESIRYAVAIDTQTGAITNLQRFDTNANADAKHVNSDGSVIVGHIECSNPGTGECEPDDEPRAVVWDGINSPPAQLTSPLSQVVGLSNSGNVVLMRYNDLDTFTYTTTQYVRSTRTKTTSTDFAYGRGNWRLSGNGKVISVPLGTSPLELFWYPATNTTDAPFPEEWTSSSILTMSEDASVFTIKNNDTGQMYISTEGTLQPVDGTDDGITAIAARDMTTDGSRFVGMAMKNDAYEGIIWDTEAGLRTMYDALASRGLELPSDVSALPASPIYISSDGTIVTFSAFSATTFWRVELTE